MSETIVLALVFGGGLILSGVMNYWIYCWLSMERLQAAWSDEEGE